MSGLNGVAGKEPTTAGFPPYIECSGCAGRGFVRGPIDEATGRRIIRDHDRCNGAGILVLRRSTGAEPLYGAPRLS